MENYINHFSDKIIALLKHLPTKEITKALQMIQATYERNGRIYAFGNGGSLALATHLVSDFNKTIFSKHLDKPQQRFQAIRIPVTEEELTAWANDVGYDMVFAGPLENYLQDKDLIIAISSSGNSPNIIKAVSLAKKRHIPIIGLSGFNGGKLNRMADAKILIKTKRGEYESVESVHGVILHLITDYFRNYFDYILSNSSK